MIRGLLATALVLASCGGTAAPTAVPAPPTEPAAAPTTADRTPPPASPTTAGAATFLAIRLTDVRTGASFALGDFPGKVTLVQAMAVW